MGGARPRLKLVYENTLTTVHSTKHDKGRGPEGPRPEKMATWQMRGFFPPAIRSGAGSPVVCVQTVCTYLEVMRNPLSVAIVLSAQKWRSRRWIGERDARNQNKVENNRLEWGLCGHPW